MSVIGKRKYRKLNVQEWAEVEAYWANGTHTLEDISAEYGVTARALQAHFKKAKIVKGESADIIRAAAHHAVRSDEVADHASRIEMFRSARTRTISNAETLERFLMSQIVIAQEEPKEAFRALSAIKGIVAAAAALERLQIVRNTALGVDDNIVDELPTITIFDLTDDQIVELRDALEDPNADDDCLPEEGEDGTVDTFPAA